MTSIIIALSTFYFSTLEEYYLGGLFLGVGNGVTDGSGTIFAILILMGFLGNDIMLKTIIWDLKLNLIILYGVMAINVGHIIWAILSIINNKKKAAQLIATQIKSEGH